MFWRKVFHVLVISVLLVGGIVSSSTAGERKSLAKVPWHKHPNTTYTVCASGCDFSSIQTAIDSVSPGDTLSLAAETFTESITIDKSLEIIGAGAENTIVQAAASPGIATSRVITVTSGVSTTIKGITIRYGVASGPWWPDYHGGGILNQGYLTLKHSAVYQNTASSSGGGIYSDGYAVNIINSLITDNEAFSGGGIYIMSANTISLINNSIKSNVALADSGGGVFLDGNSFDINEVTIDGNTISDNYAFNQGGGLNLHYLFGSDLITKFRNNTILSNSADHCAGVKMSFSDKFEITNNIIADNSAVNWGSGICVDGATRSEIAHNTIANNSGGDGSGIFVTDYIGVGNVVVITNTILVSQTIGIYVEENSTADINSTLLNGNTQSWGGPGVVAHINDYIGRPAFVDPLNGDYHIGDQSEAIEKGINVGVLTDIDGEPRSNTSPDLGADEFVGISLEKQVNTTISIPGETITYTIQVVNNLTESITGGVISDTLAVGLNFVGPIALEPPLSGTIGSAPPGLVSDLEIGLDQQITVTFPVSVSYGLAGGTVITNTAWITSNQVITPVLGSISITIANAAPIAIDDGGVAFTTNKDTAFTTGNVLSNDSDPNGDDLTVTGLITTTTLGLVTDNGDGTFGYDPDGQFDDLLPGEQATDTFSYTINDGHGGTDVAQVTIVIAEVIESYWIYLPLTRR